MSRDAPPDDGTDGRRADGGTAERSVGLQKQFRGSDWLGSLNLDVGFGRFTFARVAWTLVLTSVFVYLLLPVIFAVLISVNPSDLYTFPPTQITLKWYTQIFSRHTWVSSFVTSFQYSVLATVIAILLSSTAAYAIGRFDFKYRSLLDAGTFLPLMIPQIILGLALLLFLNLFGLIGNILGLALALSVYATPFATRSILSTMYNFDRSIEEAAMNLGADEIQTFRYITFPALLPGVLTAAIFSFVVTYANLQIAIFLQGPGVIPIPVRIFAQMQFGASPVIAAVSTVNIAIVLLAIVVVERVFGAAGALGYT